MELEFKVKIEHDKSSKEEYIIRDKGNITVGRINVLELNKRCDIKLVFYKQNEYDLLRDSIELLLKTIFRNGSVYKVNIKTLENINVKPFIDLGFELEGIFSQNEYYKGEYLDEYSFGITLDTYNKRSNIPMIELIGERVSLRNLMPDDADILAQYYIKNKKYLAPFEPARDSEFYTVEGQKKVLNESFRQMMSGKSVDLGIFKDDEFIGKVKLSNIVYGSIRSAVIGYSLDEDHQGCGYMKESVLLAQDYAFNECGLHRLEASALINNEKSKKVLQSCGFDYIGTNKKYLLINGKWEDHVLYSKVKE